jgi:hypothetical protein
VTTELTKSFSVSTLAEIERLPLPGSPAKWAPVREHFGIASFGINAWTADAGEEVIGPHQESDSFAGGHEELYFVTSGHAEFTIGEEGVAAPPGTFVWVSDPALRRGAVAREDGTTVLTFGGKPGAPFEVAAWEFLVRAAERGREGDWAGAIEHTRRGLELHRDSAELLYHRACYESLAGRLDEAREHLDAAILRDPRNRERAARDPDFEPLRA